MNNKKVVDLNITVPNNVIINLKVNGQVFSFDKHGHMFNQEVSEKLPTQSKPISYFGLFSLCSELLLTKTSCESKHSCKNTCHCNKKY